MENNKKIPGMKTCSVCGRDFPLLAENRYTARNNTLSGLAALTGGSEEGLFDAVDCPHCGCQNILNQRKREYVEECGCCGCCDEEGEDE